MLALLLMKLNEMIMIGKGMILCLLGTRFAIPCKFETGLQMLTRLTGEFPSENPPYSSTRVPAVGELDLGLLHINLLVYISRRKQKMYTDPALFRFLAVRRNRADIQ